jgi:hypothetical protein
MDLHAPVTGTLLLTARDDDGASTVLIDGDPVAHLQAGQPLTKIWFLIADLRHRPVAEGVQGRHHWRETEVWSAQHTPVLIITSGFRVSRWQLSLPGDREVTVRAEHRRGLSPVLDEDGVQAAVVHDLDRSNLYGAHTVDLRTPLLSVVQAAALTEYLRKRVGAWYEPCG